MLWKQYPVLLYLRKENPHYKNFRGLTHTCTKSTTLKVFWTHLNYNNNKRSCWSLKRSSTRRRHPSVLPSGEQSNRERKHPRGLGPARPAPRGRLPPYCSARRAGPRSPGRRGPAAQPTWRAPAAAWTSCSNWPSASASQAPPAASHPSLERGWAPGGPGPRPEPPSLRKASARWAPEERAGGGWGRRRKRRRFTAPSWVAGRPEKTPASTRWRPSPAWRALPSTAHTPLQSPFAGRRWGPLSGWRGPLPPPRFCPRGGRKKGAGSRRRRCCPAEMILVTRQRERPAMIGGSRTNLREVYLYIHAEVCYRRGCCCSSVSSHSWDPKISGLVRVLFCSMHQG